MFSFVCQRAAVLMLGQKRARERGLVSGEVEVFKESDRGAFSLKDTTRDVHFFSEVSK